jgi:hypothetical protein
MLGVKLVLLGGEVLGDEGVPDDVVVLCQSGLPPSDLILARDRRAMPLHAAPEQK